MKKYFIVVSIGITVSTNALCEINVCGNVHNYNTLLNYGGTSGYTVYTVMSATPDDNGVLVGYSSGDCVCVKCAIKSGNTYTGCTAYDESNWPYPGYGYPSDWKTHCTEETPEPETYAWDEYLDGLSCQPCPTGSYGAYESYITHQETECAYCDNNYYWNDSMKQCMPCPGGGQTNSPLYQNSHISITKCYLPTDKEYSDSTGKYSYTQNCYYKN